MADLDHKALIAGLPPEVRADLTTCTDAHGVRHFALHIGAIGLCAASILGGAPFVVPIMLVQGVLISFLFTALHETTHRTPFRTDAFNLWVGRLCGFIVLIGPEWFRSFHLAHHRHTNDPERDPELANPKPDTLWRYIVYLSGVRDVSKRVTVLIRNATRLNEDAYVPEAARPRIQSEARVMLALYASLAGLSLLLWTPALLMVWLLPLLMGGPFLRAYLLAEHARCPHAASMFENTRTTLTTRFVRALAWNMPFHAEHHAYPAVPFHKLPALHEIAKDHIADVQPGYTAFHQNYVNEALGEGRRP